MAAEWLQRVDDSPRRGALGAAAFGVEGHVLVFLAFFPRRLLKPGAAIERVRGLVPLPLSGLRRTPLHGQPSQ